MAHIYSLSFHESSWTRYDTSLLSFVSKERRNKILNYHFDIDKKLSLYAALLTRMEICNWTGISATQLSFSIEPQKKPLLISVPEVYFNFSHTRNFILLGISACTEIGVDVEKIKKAPFEIADTVFHPLEKEYIFNTPKESRNLCFYQIWTQKEAFTKQSGIGLSCNLTDLNMLDSSLSPFLYSWQAHGYICSVYLPSYEQLNFKTVHLKDIREFYEHYTLEE